MPLGFRAGNWVVCIGGTMIGKLGLPELLVILGIALLIFGPGKLADLGKGLGEGIRNFKSSAGSGKESQDIPPAEKK